jgi:hypothetical protein
LTTNQVLAVLKPGEWTSLITIIGHVAHLVEPEAAMRVYASRIYDANKTPRMDRRPDFMEMVRRGTRTVIINRLQSAIRKGLVESRNVPEGMIRIPGRSGPVRECPEYRLITK